MKNYPLLILLFISLFYSCKLKEELGPLYPPIGNSGANAVAFSENGKLFYGGPYTSGGINYAESSAWLDQFGLHLNCQGYYVGTDQSALVYIQIPGFLDKGVFVLGDTTQNNADYKNKTLEYWTDTLHTGQLNVSTYDPVHRIVSGTFYFNGKSFPGDELKITEGQFDLKY
ncbi:MAG: DUF6252 family protein [Bacteroidia bacterium]